MPNVERELDPTVRRIERAEMSSLRAEIRKRQEDFLSLVRRVVEAESASGDADGSKRVVSLLSGHAQNIKAIDTIERIESDEYGEHLRVRAFGKSATKEEQVLIIGHTDTVHPRGSLASRPFKIEGERVYAPGIYDMKANACLAIEALAVCEHLDLRPERPITLLLTCDEETGSKHGGRELVEQESMRASHVLVCEPSGKNRAVKTARKGTGLFNITATGRASHAGLEPEKGASAIHEIARQIIALQELSRPQDGTTINAGVVRGGTNANVVAAEAFAEIDVRFGTMREAERIARAFENLQAFDERVRLRVDGEINRPPLERTAQVVELYAHARHLASLMDYELPETSVGGASDGNFAAAFCPRVLDGLGIEGDGAHTDYEHILTSDIAPRGALLCALLLSL